MNIPCPHCALMMQADKGVCPHCHRALHADQAIATQKTIEKLAADQKPLTMDDHEHLLDRLRILERRVDELEGQASANRWTRMIQRSILVGLLAGMLGGGVFGCVQFDAEPARNIDRLSEMLIHAICAAPFGAIVGLVIVRVIITLIGPNDRPTKL